MKKSFLFLALAVTIAFTSCSKDDDNDPIVGSWVADSSASFNGGETQTNLDVWKFDSNNTGQYSETQNGNTNVQSAFTWSKNGNNYSVDYTNTELSADIFVIGELFGSKTLENSQGFTVAIKE